MSSETSSDHARLRAWVEANRKWRKKGGPHAVVSTITESGQVLAELHEEDLDAVLADNEQLRAQLAQTLSQHAAAWQLVDQYAQTLTHAIGCVRQLRQDLAETREVALDLIRALGRAGLTARRLTSDDVFALEEARLAAKRALGLDAPAAADPGGTSSPCGAQDGAGRDGSGETQPGKGGEILGPESTVTGFGPASEIPGQQHDEAGD